MTTLTKCRIDKKFCFSWLLRHGAVKENLSMDDNGFVPMSEIISKLNKKSKSKVVTVDDITDIVANCPKQRFKIEIIGGTTQIRANQGHSMKQTMSIELEAIQKFSERVFHGTSKSAWQIIEEKGLSRMTRNHIHMALESGLEKHRIRSQLFIEIDANKALEDGIKFFKSDNGVILSPGDQNGILHPKYFKSVHNF